MHIDLNCDMGEGFGAYTIGSDEQVMPFITSANIACGFHASDPATIRNTVRMAKAHGVAVGAHPSYPDLVGFGRRPMELSAEEVTADLIYQIGALSAFCKCEGIKLQHVKPHGALYNKAAVSRAVNSLERRGLLKRGAAPEHRLRTQLYLTAAGHDLHAQGTGERLHSEDELFAGLAPEDRARLLQMLRQLMRNLDKNRD